MQGVVFLDKPLGWSSRKAVNAVARIFSTEGEKRIKAGHTGTLDPMATGMLPVLLGDATRFADVGLQAEKAYRVSFDLSYQTDTLDAEGDTTARFDGVVAEADLLAALDAFRGEMMQVPPAYSAIRIDGKRAYDLARKGEMVAMEARPVTILALELVAFAFPLVTLDVRCSKGTYIRSLARDIGVALGMGGCVTALRRTSTGGWPAVMMVTLEQLEAQREACLLPMAHWLRHMRQLQLPQDQARRFLHGQRLQMPEMAAGEPAQDVALFCGQTFLGSGRLESGMRQMVLHPAKILPSAQRRFL